MVSKYRKKKAKKKTWYNRRKKKTMPCEPVSADGQPGPVSQETSVVCGSIHQGFFSMKHPGLQCSVIASTAAVYAYYYPIDEWEGHHLDRIVIDGDNIFDECIQLRKIRPQMLTINQVPRNIRHNSENYFVDVCDDEVLFGSLVVNNSDIGCSLESAIQQVFNISDSGLLVIGQDGFTMLVYQKSETYFLFDSHARDGSGLSSADGTCVLLSIPSVRSLYNHIVSLAESLNMFHPSILFELTAVKICRLENIHVGSPGHLENQGRRKRTKQAVNRRQRYLNNAICRESRRESARRSQRVKYKNDFAYRERKQISEKTRHCRQQLKYKDDSTYKENKRIYEKNKQQRRYKTDFTYKEEKQVTEQKKQRQKYKTEPVYKLYKKCAEQKRQQFKYKSDPSFRHRKRCQVNRKHGRDDTCTTKRSRGSKRDLQACDLKIQQSKSRMWAA